MGIDRARGKPPQGRKMERGAGKEGDGSYRKYFFLEWMRKGLEKDFPAGFSAYVFFYYPGLGTDCDFCFSLRRSARGGEDSVFCKDRGLRERCGGGVLAEEGDSISHVHKRARPPPRGFNARAVKLS